MSEFIAEAKVLVRPDTRAFRAELVAELKKITASIPPIVIPVTSTGSAAVARANAEIVATTQAASAAADTQVASERRRGVAAQQSSIALTRLAQASQLGLAAEARLAGAADVASLKTSNLARARAILSETSGAVALAERGVAAALEGGNIALIDATSRTLALAEAQQFEATSAIKATIVQDAHAASLQKTASAQAFAARGAGATGLSLLGVRGATLAANKEFLAGAAAVAIFTKSVGLAANLEQELNVFRVTAQATAKELEAVSETAKELGADITLPAVSAGDAAQAMTELAKAGLSVQDSLAGARGVLQLATAAQIDNAAATEIAVSAINAFGLAGDQAVHVADLLANASIQAQGSISDMGAALVQAAAVSRQVGLSLDDTVALLTLLAKNGIQGGQAGTVLRVALLRLINPSKEAAAVIKQLGISIRDAQGRVRPQIFADFAEASQSLTKANRDAAAAIVFGTRGIRAQAILGREGADALEAMREAVERQGAASEIAGARTAGFSGATEALKNSLETLGTTLGQVVLGPLTSFVDSLNEIISTVNRVTDVIGGLVGKVSNIKIPPIKIDIGPIDVDTEGTTAGETFGKAFSVAAKVAIISRVSSLPIAIAIEAGAPQKVNDLRKSIFQLKGDASDTVVEIQEIFKTFRQAGGGISSLNQAAVALQKLIDKLKNGDAEAQRLAGRVENLLKQIQQTGDIPPISVPVKLFLASVPDIKIPDVPAKITFDKSDLRTKGQEAGRLGGNAALDALTSVLSPEAGRVLGFNLLESVGQGMADAAKDIKIPQIISPEQLSGQLGALAETRQRERLFGSRGARLDTARKQREKLLKDLQDPDIKNFQKKRQAVLDELDSVENEIASIQNEIASDAERHAREIETARRKADQAFLSILGGRQAKAENLILRAQGTESLKDDIKFTEQFRSLLRRQVEEVRKRVKDAEERVKQIQDLTRRIINAGLQLKKLREQRRQQIKDQAQERFERLKSSIELDIEFAQITGNKAAEIRSRQQEIRILQERIRHVKRGTADWKELRNAIAEQKEEIKKLKGESEDRGKAFAELTFSFLQQQQGFAANLLGNLIPSGATGGLVGGTTAGGIPIQPALPSPAAGVRTAAAISTGEAWARGDVKTQIVLLRQILSVLETGHRQAQHPEARQQRRTASAFMDVM